MPGVSGKMGVLAGVCGVFHLLALSPLFSRKKKSDSQHFSLSQLGFGEFKLCLLAYSPRIVYPYEGSGSLAGLQLLNHKTKRN